MYLLVFVTLIVSMIGIYTQVLALQTARMFANQNSVARSMLQWQSAAVSMAASIIKTNNANYIPLATTGCRLTFTAIPGTPPPIASCPSPFFMNGQSNPGTAINSTGGVLTDNSAPPVLNLVNKYQALPAPAHYLTECVRLPAVCTATGVDGCTACSSLYDTADYQFFSVLYQTATGQNLVVTFVPAVKTSSANPSGFLSLVLGNQIGLSASDLLQQLQHTGMPLYTYGTISVVAGIATFVAAGTTPAIGTTYILPGGFATNITNTKGAVAVIGSPDGF